ncbi:GntR family transcriptional regulator [Mesorhizobium australicum]|uniref:Transcriptional regulator, GntR family n=1 Tax=Mesorhizobium australicum TaxID=536018 RepID=A0A1X7NG82_9HYPH|nr:GntR family transcriptional regulator [Mesorhizobium australicum]SMH36730.1 transcriptional regulator, GntR family [Mesorhizobium australicum]
MTSKPRFGLNAVDAVPLHEKVYQEIVKALMSGQFAPGQKLTSRKLAAELGTSDMPVRSALSRLQSLRALSALPNGSMEVPPMTADAFRQLMETRAVLEGAATEAATGLINGNNLRTVRRNCNALTEAARAGDIELYLRLNYEFKFSIYRHCGNDCMIFLIETLWMQVGPFLRSYASTFAGDLSGILEIDYHEEALAALEAKDAARARDAIIRDIREGAAYLLKYAHFHDTPAA